MNKPRPNNTSSIFNYLSLLLLPSMCKEWLIFKYYATCGRARNGGPYHSHPTMCFKTCEREGRGCMKVRRIGEPSGEVAWRAGDCRKCLHSIDDKSWWKNEGYGEDRSLPGDPEDQKVSEAQGAPTTTTRNHTKGPAPRKSHPRQNSIHSTESEVNRNTYQPRDDPQKKILDGDFELDWLKTTWMGKTLPENGRVHAWVDIQYEQRRSSRAYPPANEAKTPAASVCSASSVSTPSDLVSQAPSSIPNKVMMQTAQDVVRLGQPPDVLQDWTRDMLRSAHYATSSNVLPQNTGVSAPKQKQQGPRSILPKNQTGHHRITTLNERSQESRGSKRHRSPDPFMGYVGPPGSATSKP